MHYLIFAALILLLTVGTVFSESAQTKEIRFCVFSNLQIKLPLHNS